MDLFMKNTLLAAMQTSLFKETMDYQKQLQTPPAKTKKPKINTTIPENTFIMAYIISISSKILFLCNLEKAEYFLLIKN